MPWSAPSFAPQNLKTTNHDEADLLKTTKVWQATGSYTTNKLRIHGTAIGSLQQVEAIAGLAYPEHPKSFGATPF